MKIIFTGGGTMGHILPIVAVVREIRKIYPGPDIKLYYIGPRHDYGSVLMQEANVKIHNILTGKIRRYFDVRNFIDILKVPVGILQSFCLLFWLSPDLVFSKGGYGSFPLSFAAFILRVPIILQESDFHAGLAAKIISRFASQIFTSFPGTEYFPKDKTMCLGNPIRKDLLNGSKEKAKTMFNLMGDKPMLLILGGSLGAQSINNLILEILQGLLKNFEILHQTGQANIKIVEMEAKAYLNEKTAPYYHSLPFFNEEQLKNALSVADFIISRAGAGALFEIAAVKKPSLLIPLPNSAQDHQVKNAYRLAEAGAAEIVEEQNLKPNFFLQRLESIALNPRITEAMSKNAGEFAKPEAAHQIANFIIEFLSLN